MRHRVRPGQLVPALVCVSLLAVGALPAPAGARHPRAHSAAEGAEKPYEEGYAGVFPDDFCNEATCSNPETSQGNILDKTYGGSGHITLEAQNCAAVTFSYSVDNTQLFTVTVAPGKTAYFKFSHTLEPGFHTFLLTASNPHCPNPPLFSEVDGTHIEIWLRYHIRWASEPYTFNAVAKEPLDSLIVAEPFTYSGARWSSHAGSVAVKLGRDTLGHETPARFERTLRLPDWSTPNCTGKLTAFQYPKMITLRLAGKKRATVLYAKGAHLGKRELNRGDLACAGEKLAQLSGTAVLRTAAPNLGFRPLGEPARPGDFDPANLIFAAQLVHTPRSIVAGVFARTIRIGRESIPAATMSPTPLLGEQHQSTTIRSQNGPTTASGRVLSEANLTLGSLNCDACVLAVKGNVHVHGPVSGVGAIIASGNITIDGPVTLHPDNAIALLTPGTLTLKQ